MDDLEFSIGVPLFDVASRQARFDYQLGEHAFTERLTFPEGFAPERAELPAFAALLELTAFVLGVSYYKLKAPLDIVAPQIGLDAARLAFVVDVYENGLGEFYARNRLQRYGKLRIKAGGVQNPGGLYSATGDALLPIGGGKDSLVSVQLLEAMGLGFAAFAVNPKGPIISSLAEIGGRGLCVDRVLDPAMIALSTAPGYFNGHVPSTAINSMIAALVAVLFGFDRIVLSNERSADEGNVSHDGRIANHQYSKSFKFENSIASVLSAVTGGVLGYFSLLRPLSEMQIAAIFARSERFDRVFSSCNVNFRLFGSPEKLWCGKCPKCHFVYLMLATAMTPKRLIGIFGQDLLAQPGNEASYRELSGLAGQKPWECVGEILEAAAALWHLANDDKWRDRALIVALKGDLERQYGAEALVKGRADFMTSSSKHRLPDRLAELVTHAA